MDRARLLRRWTLGTLEPEAWTHEAHLLVALHTLLAERAVRGDGHDAVPGAVAALRSSIEAHGRRVGRPDRDHETLTTYYVAAIDRFLVDRLGVGRPLTRVALDRLVDVLLAWPEVDRDAPRRLWDATTLASEAARAGWIPPTTGVAPGAGDDLALVA